MRGPLGGSSHDGKNSAISIASRQIRWPYQTTVDSYRTDLVLGYFGDGVNRVDREIVGIAGRKVKVPEDYSLRNARRYSRSSSQLSTT